MATGSVAYHCVALKKERQLQSALGTPVGHRGRALELYDSCTGQAGAFLERRFGSRPDYETVRWEDALDDLESLAGSARGILDEAAFRRTEKRVRRTLLEMRPRDPFKQRWASDSVLARCCYLTCRLAKPEVVVETGVAYGVSSAFILAAMVENGRGTLHSVDLPPLRRGAERSWGMAIPAESKGRWNFHRGSSRRILPALLRELGTVDLFLHDSLHTRRNMRFEFEAMWLALRPGGILLADDVERNGAFGELKKRAPALWRVVKDRETQPLHGNAAPVTFGVAVK